MSSRSVGFAQGRVATEAGGGNASAEERSPLDHLLRPRSIAVVGASATSGSFGHSVVENVERAGYAGELYLVNPKQEVIGGRRCFASVGELPKGVDCAVLAIPRRAVIESLTACAQRGVRSAIVFSAGFAELDEAGKAEQEQMARLAADHGMVIEGPNCLGMVNFIDSIPLTFVSVSDPHLDAPKGVAIISQSGAMAAVLGVSLRAHGLGISYLISTGNEAATSVEDYLEYLVDDERTPVFVLIVELFRQPQKFLELASRARACGKEILLLHPGRSVSARTAAVTHTGALAGDYEVMKACVEHAGVVLVETLEELLDVSEILMRSRSLPSRGACVLTESGAFKALALDFSDKVGLELPPLAAETQSVLRQAMPDFIQPSNPLDITAQPLIDVDLYRRTLPLLLADESIGSLVLTIILSDKGTASRKLAPILDAIRAANSTKPIIFAALDEGAEIDEHFVEKLRELGVPFFPSPERALRALADTTRAARRRTSGRVSQHPPVSLPFALYPRILPEYRSKEILAAIGIRIPKGALARTVDEAQRIAANLGFPIALKAQSAHLSHKSNAGAVILNVSGAAQLAESWQSLLRAVKQAAPTIAVEGVLVEEMCPEGVELMAGVRRDPQWGPMLLVGFGGVLAEAVNDARLFPPDLEIDSIVSEILSLKCARLLQGRRGSRDADVRAVAKIVRRLGDLALDHPEIREVDVNPIVVYPEGAGAVALDALVLVE